MIGWLKINIIFLLLLSFIFICGCEKKDMYINLGKYPQKEVTEEKLISSLKTIKETNDLGYIEYNNDEYKYSDGKFYLVEPIEWIVLEKNDKEYKLLSKKIIDQEVFYTSQENRFDSGKIIFPKNYEYSTIRAWLNGYDGSNYGVNDYTNQGFYNIAFTDEEKGMIQNVSIGDTSDKVYLLNESDVLNVKYKFNSNPREEDKNRRAEVTGYAKAKGCFYYDENNIDYLNKGNWWVYQLEYSGLTEFNTSIVNYAGMMSHLGDPDSNGLVAVIGYTNVYDETIGVRPSLTIMK